MNEDEARTILLVKAIEQHDTEGQLLPLTVRDGITQRIRAALQNPQKDLANKTGRSDERDEAFLLQRAVGSSRVDLQACKLEYSIVSPK